MCANITDVEKKKSAFFPRSLANIFCTVGICTVHLFGTDNMHCIIGTENTFCMTDTDSTGLFYTADTDSTFYMTDIDKYLL